MKKLFAKRDGKAAANQIALRGGAYSLAVTAIVLAILMVINTLVSLLPSSMTRFDISAAKLYSITSDTKVVVNALDRDVTIYWIVQSDKEDSVIENLLSKYEALSEHISVVKKNPDVYPTFAAQYTDDTVKNNSLVVECGERSRYIAYDEIYVSEPNMSTYSYDNSFDGEGCITSAIDYVVRETLPKVYTLSGHGEEALPETFSNQVKRQNFETEDISLLTSEVPEDASCVLIYSPQSDISEKEAELLMSYVEKGGKLMVFAGPLKDDALENLYSVIGKYGVSVNEGIVVESDTEYCAFQQPYILLPTLESSDITDPLINESYKAIVPVASGLTVQYNSKADTVTLLSSSDTAYSKTAGYSITTYEKEDGDIDGPFALGVSVDINDGGRIIWISSSDFLNDIYNSYSSGANVDLAMNGLSALIGESEAVAIRAKSLSYNYLTISSAQASTLKTLMLGVFPGIFMLAGIIVVAARRAKRNEKSA